MFKTRGGGGGQRPFEQWKNFTIGIWWLPLYTGFLAPYMSKCINHYDHGSYNLWWHEEECWRSGGQTPLSLPHARASGCWRWPAEIQVKINTREFVIKLRWCKYTCTKLHISFVGTLPPQQERPAEGWQEGGSLQCRTKTRWWWRRRLRPRSEIRDQRAASQSPQNSDQI